MLVVLCIGNHDCNDASASQDEGQAQEHLAKEISACITKSDSERCVVFTHLCAVFYTHYHFARLSPDCTIKPFSDSNAIKYSGLGVQLYDISRPTSTAASNIWCSKDVSNRYNAQLSGESCFPRRDEEAY